MSEPGSRACWASFPPMVTTIMVSPEAGKPPMALSAWSSWVAMRVLLVAPKAETSMTSVIEG